MSKEHEAGKALATVSEKPLNQAQVKNLREIVEGDFDDLRESILVDISNRASKKQEEVTERYSKQADLSDARKKLRKIADDAQKKADDLLNSVQNGELGIKVDGPQWRVFKVECNEDKLTQEGLGRELRKIDSAKHRLLHVLDVVINREVRSFTRTILIQSLPGSGAMEIISDQPSKEDMMALIAAELAKNNQDDLEVLMSDDEIEQAKGNK